MPSDHLARTQTVASPRNREPIVCPSLAVYHRTVAHVCIPWFTRASVRGFGQTSWGQTQMTAKLYALAWPIAFAAVGMCAAIAYARVHTLQEKAPQIECPYGSEQLDKWGVPRRGL